MATFLMQMANIDCGFNRSMQHTTDCVSKLLRRPVESAADNCHPRFCPKFAICEPKAINVPGLTGDQPAAEKHNCGNSG
jgi:hypothetical protein